MSRTTFAGAKFDLRRDTEECNALGQDWADDPEDLEQLPRPGRPRGLAAQPAGREGHEPDGVAGRSPTRGMPNLNLSEEQIDQLVAYLVTLK